MLANSFSVMPGEGWRRSMVTGSSAAVRNMKRMMVMSLIYLPLNRQGALLEPVGLVSGAPRKECDTSIACAAFPVNQKANGRRHESIAL